MKPTHFGDAIADAIRLLEDRSVETRLQAVARLDKLIHDVPQGDTTLRPRMAAALLGRLRIESNARESSVVHSRRAFFERSSISATAFRNMANGEVIPSERHLRFLAENFGDPEVCILFWTLRRHCGKKIVARIAGARREDGTGDRGWQKSI